MWTYTMRVLKYAWKCLGIINNFIKCFKNMIKFLLPVSIDSRKVNIEEGIIPYWPIIFLRCGYLNIHIVFEYLIFDFGQHWNTKSKILIYYANFWITKNVYWEELKIIFPWKLSVCILFSFRLHKENSSENAAFSKLQNFLRTSTVSI